MTELVLRDLRKAYGDAEVLHGLDLKVEDGEFCVFVGPSGCGKSTLLRLICGLDEITGGEMLIDGEIVNDVPPARRGVAMVFQTYALYPHMTVAQNMGYALRLARTPKAEIAGRVRGAAEILRIEPLLGRKPRELSGGQRQRVAIGRAIVREPKLFLFDEPLSNLDAALRVEMRLEIAKLKNRLGTTMIYVTHDQTEAMTLADKIVVMNGGRIEQVGGPLDLYDRPANRFVAGFIGSPRMNFAQCEVARESGDAVARLPNGARLTLPGADVAPGAYELGSRPEAVTLREGDEAEVRLIEHLGADAYAYLDSGEEDADPLVARLPGDSRIAPGDRVALDVAPEGLHLFDRNGAAVWRGGRRAVHGEAA